MTLQQKIRDRVWDRVFNVSPISDMYFYVHERMKHKAKWEIHNVTEEASGGFIDEWVQDKLKEYKIES